MEIVRTDMEIADIYNKCVDGEENGESAYPCMTYEQGVKACLDWLEGGDPIFGLRLNN